MLLNVEAASSHWGDVTSLWDSLKVLVVLVELVEMVGVPGSNREASDIKKRANFIKTLYSIHLASGKNTLTF